MVTVIVWLICIVIAVIMVYSTFSKTPTKVRKEDTEEIKKTDEKKKDEDKKVAETKPETISKFQRGTRAETNSDWVWVVIFSGVLFFLWGMKPTGGETPIAGEGAVYFPVYGVLFASLIGAISILLVSICLDYKLDALAMIVFIVAICVGVFGITSGWFLPVQKGLGFSLFNHDEMIAIRETFFVWVGLIFFLIVISLQPRLLIVILFVFGCVYISQKSKMPHRNTTQQSQTIIQSDTKSI